MFRTRGVRKTLQKSAILFSGRSPINGENGTITIPFTVSNANTVTSTQVTDKTARKTVTFETAHTVFEYTRRITRVPLPSLAFELNKYWKRGGREVLKPCVIINAFFIVHDSIRRTTDCHTRTHIHSKLRAKSKTFDSNFLAEVPKTREKTFFYAQPDNLFYIRITLTNSNFEQLLAMIPLLAKGQAWD